MAFDNSRNIRTALITAGLLWNMLCTAQMANSAADTSVDNTPDSRVVKLIYVHGSNTNTDNSKTVYERNAKSLHLMLLKTFPKNEYFVKHTLENGKYSLAQEPVAFFWGFQSHPEVAFMYNQQGLAQQLKSKIKISIAQKVRNFLGSLLHDAVWVEKLGNKKAITQNLFETAHPNNEHVQPVIYFGHSAGSLVLFNYMLYRTPYIDIKVLSEHIKVDPSALAELKSIDAKPTCLQALLDTQAVRFDNTGQIVPFFHGIESSARQALQAITKSYVAEKLSQINEYTKTSCLRDGDVKGFITFGSPLAVFESELGNENSSERYLTGYMLKYLLENGIFWLHVNHPNDPLGFPFPNNDMEKQLAALFDIKLEHEKTGFMYSYNAIKKGPNFLRAHLWYWADTSTFARVINTGYEKGYRHSQPAPITHK